MRWFLYATNQGSSWQSYRNPRWLEWIELGFIRPDTPRYAGPPPRVGTPIDNVLRDPWREAS